MIRNKAELMMRRRIYWQFVLADSAMVAFSRRTRIPTSAGAWKWGPYVDGAPQIIRIIPAKRRYANSNVNSEAGEIDNYPFQINGRWDMNIAEDDTFWWEGKKYVIKSIDQDRDEKTMAFATYYGEPN